HIIVKKSIHKKSICVKKFFYKKGLTYCKKYDRLFLPQKGFIFLRRFLKTACAPEGGSKTHY
ncbi:MAG: hypothetical protein IJO75_04370, partial [Clostridia bacterium]|nr:hypothetical protein [Clostridia bacterium]